ncbi:hypothetical protein BH11ARM2_BH11ARM2_35080 [soil metagenome]
MAQMPGMDKGVSGKRFVPALFLGVVVFAAVMGFGTWWLAQSTTPWLKARFERQQAEARAQQHASVKTP